MSISISTDGEMRINREKTALNQFIDKFVIKSNLFGSWNDSLRTEQEHRSSDCNELKEEKHICCKIGVAILDPGEVSNPGLYTGVLSKKMLD